MGKTILILAIAAAFVAGSITAGTIAFADDPDDDDLSSLLCPIGQSMIGILFEDDDEILDIICDTGVSGPPGPINVYNNTSTTITVLRGQPTVQDEILCDEGDIATGGGHTNVGANSNLVVTHSQPQIDLNGVPNGWITIVYLPSTSPGLADGHRTHVVCIDLAPLRP